MRTLIFNANVITGDGRTVLEDHSIVIEDELIDGLLACPYPNYDPADQIIDAKGSFVIPGIINNHSHDITLGPRFGTNGGPPLSKLRVIQNLNQHLLEGSTTLVNVDGFSTMEEVEKVKPLTPILIHTLSSHLPKYLEIAKFINLGGVLESHCQLTLREMVEKGTVGIGEIGTMLDMSWFLLMGIPRVIKTKTGIQISMDDARIIYSSLFTHFTEEKAAEDLMKKRGVLATWEDVRDLAEKGSVYVNLSTEACHEAAEIAKKLGVPLQMHNTSETKHLVIEFAKDLKELLIACHSNLDYRPQEAVEVAKAVKKEGGWVDVQTGDFFRARQFYHDHATLLAILAEGVADTISTDTMGGGYYDPILKVLEYAVQQNVIELPQAIALATGNVIKAFPKIAHNRGQIAEGKVADLVVLSPNSIAEVRTVLIGGKVVVNKGEIVTFSTE